MGIDGEVRAEIEADVEGDKEEGEMDEDAGKAIGGDAFGARKGL